ncbi:MAG: T9SS type A sorting domain-containing protein [Saprospiraceae bacterium]|nr:T9SS type A sorting domain-containing protein [Saprospiraceae bacterium]
MKKIVFLCGFIGFAISVHAQKYDHNWVMGAATIVDTFPLFEIISVIHAESGLDFDTIPMHGRYRLNTGSTTWSDAEGNLKYYSNGKAVFNTAGVIMENGDSLNYGEIWEKQSQSYAASNAIVPLPDPGGNLNLSYLIHGELVHGESFIEGYSTFIGDIRYSKIKTDGGMDGLGEVLEKNVVLVKDTFENMEVAQHANGRDWWIIGAQLYTNKFFSFLLTDKGIQGPFIQFLGKGYKADIPAAGSFGFLVMNQQGTQMARINTDTALTVYDFDRCSGTFTSYRTLAFDEPIVVAGAGTIGDMEFSPSGRYLYILNNAPCYQVDLWADTLKLTPLELLGETKFKCNIGRGLAQLGPDGRIYIAPTGSGLCLHVLKYPELPGNECELTINEIDLPVYTHNSLVHYPNYRLGAMEGSPCDTLSTSVAEPGPQGELKIYPNPASGPVQIEITLSEYGRQDTELIIVDALGREVHRHRYTPYAYLHTWDTSQVPNGTYILQLFSDQQPVATSRVVVIHE